MPNKQIETAASVPVSGTGVQREPRKRARVPPDRWFCPLNRIAERERFDAEMRRIGGYKGR
jgi:hypothetical protein